MIVLTAYFVGRVFPASKAPDDQSQNSDADQSGGHTRYADGNHSLPAETHNVVVRRPFRAGDSIHRSRHQLAIVSCHDTVV